MISNHFPAIERKLRKAYHFHRTMAFAAWVLTLPALAAFCIVHTHGTPGEQEAGTWLSGAILLLLIALAIREHIITRRRRTAYKTYFPSLSL